MKIVIDLDNVRTLPTWDFSVKLNDYVYTTRFPKAEELNVFRGKQKTFEEICLALQKFINEPHANLLEWGPHRVLGFAAGYLEYLRLFIEQFKAAASLPTAAEVVAQQMGKITGEEHGA